MMNWLGPLGGIILVDLVLSGDNALVIGAVAAQVSGWKRWLLLLCGGGGAILVRIAFTIAASLLLHIPLLQAIGGIVLLLIAIRLLLERLKTEKPRSEEASGQSLGSMLITILVADVTMSLDNVLAVGALASAQWGLILPGLVISIGLMLVGSALVASLMRRLPWSLDVAAFVLAWTSAQLLLADPLLARVLAMSPCIGVHKRVLIPGIAFAVILVTEGVILMRRRSGR